MHPACREEYRLEYWRGRTARRRVTEERLAPALAPLVGVLDDTRQRDRLTAFAQWAIACAREELSRSLSSARRVEVQRHLEFAEMILSASRVAASSARR